MAFFKDANGDAIFSDPEEGEDLYYALTDRNFSVIGLARRMPEDLSSEHDPWAMPIRYSAYGRAQAYPRADHDRNGTVEFADLSPAGILTFNRLWGDPNFNADVDLNNDGQTPNDECTTAVLGNWLATIPEGRISNPTTLGGGPLMDNIVGYDGYVFDDATELYCVRNRWYDPNVGRWLTRDPAGYVDGVNRYEYVGSKPINAIDPSGRQSVIETVHDMLNGGRRCSAWKGKAALTEASGWPLVDIKIEVELEIGVAGKRIKDSHLPSELDEGPLFKRKFTLPWSFYAPLYEIQGDQINLADLSGTPCYKSYRAHVVCKQDCKCKDSVSTRYFDYSKSRIWLEGRLTLQGGMGNAFSGWYTGGFKTSSLGCTVPPRVLSEARRVLEGDCASESMAAELEGRMFEN